MQNVQNCYRLQNWRKYKAHCLNRTSSLPDLAFNIILIFCRFMRNKQALFSPFFTSEKKKTRVLRFFTLSPHVLLILAARYVIETSLVLSAALIATYVAFLVCYSLLDNI